MKRNIIIGIFLVLSILFFATSMGKTYSRYKINKSSDIEVSSKSFSFDAKKTSDTITFSRTDDTKDTEIILTEDQDFDIEIINNNDYETTYEVVVDDSSKFNLIGDTISKTIEPNKKDTISLTLHINNFESPLKKVTINVTAVKPYKSEPITLTYNVVQQGAIQTIEDLLDLSLNIRGMDKNGQAKAVTDISTQRFKLTRDLDFEDYGSYDDAFRTDYGDVNLNGIHADNIYGELTSDTGFLPIGELDHSFKGVFNGDNHYIKNLEIHKSLQKFIGLFGAVEGGTIKNLRVVEGRVVNENQAAGLVVGKLINGTVTNVRVEGGSVQSNDKDNQTEDTYTGGIIGFVTNNSLVSYCYNSATVTTQFKGDATTYSGPAGGVTAWMSTSTIDHCENEGTITGQSYVGGIVGFSGMQDETNDAGSGTVSNCENRGVVKTYVTNSNSGGKHIGGIAGYNKATGIIESSTNYATGHISGLSNVGGIVGNSPGIIRNCTNYSSSITSSDSKVGKIQGSGDSANNTSRNNQNFG